MTGIKSKKEIEIMKKAGGILAEVLLEVLENVKPGVSELELDALAEKLILRKGGEPAFKKVPGYRHTICVSTNDVVVHGIPTEYRFKEGDVVGIDCGVYYKGFNTDMAETILVQNSKFKIQNDNAKIKNFLEIGKKALNEAIKQAVPGNKVGHISKTIQGIIEGAGYSVVRTLVGHGIGKSLHEEPEIPGILFEPIEKTSLLKVGMTVAIEAIYNMGTEDVVYSESDGWTIKSKDSSVSGLYERTILITKQGPVVLTV